MKTGSSEEWTRTTDTRIMIPLYDADTIQKILKDPRILAIANQWLTPALQKALAP